MNIIINQEQKQTPNKHLKTFNNLRGWSHQQQGAQHLQGCRRDRTNYLCKNYPEIVLTSEAQIVQLHLVKIIVQQDQ
jgi:hypothetical protein